MAINEVRALEALLGRLRQLYDELKLLHGGVAVLHTEVAVAALESHLHRLRAEPR